MCNIGNDIRFIDNISWFISEHDFYLIQQHRIFDDNTVIFSLLEVVYIARQQRGCGVIYQKPLLINGSQLAIDSLHIPAIKFIGKNQLV